MLSKNEERIMMIPGIEKRVMGREVGRMTLAELRREKTVLQAWLRDANAVKRRRIGFILAEIEARKRAKAVLEKKMASSATLVREAG